MFSTLSKKTLAKALLLKNAPVYVQFYITARCNYTCKQCNIIYANSDVRELTISEIEHIADNLAEIGVAIVLLTGGEPFMRKDLPQIIYAFESRGIHVRMQTNGYASEEQIVSAIEAGGEDISISLDSLNFALQDNINGDINGSAARAIQAISYFTKYLPENGFASLGCVLQPSNFKDVERVIKFGTAISWYTSLVPVHVTKYTEPRGFRIFDNALNFSSDNYSSVDALIERIREMRHQGYLLYDSDQYLDDIKRFIRGEAITWRAKNKNLCDSPNLYFAILPNGDFAPCCDFRMTNSYQVYSRDFPSIYKNSLWRREVTDITKKCSGCMYGSYPEMTIAMRFMSATIQRIANFYAKTPSKNKWPISYDELLETIRQIR